MTYAVKTEDNLCTSCGHEREMMEMMMEINQS